MESMSWYQEVVITSKSMQSMPWCQKVCHNVKKFVVTSKRTPWRQIIEKVHHGVKKVHHEGGGGHEAYVVTSKTCHNAKKCVKTSNNTSVFHSVKHTADVPHYNVHDIQCTVCVLYRRYSHYYGSATAESRWFCHGVTRVLHGCPRIDDPGWSGLWTGTVGLKPRSHLPGSSPRMWSGVIRGWSGLIRGSSLANPGWTGVIRVDPWLGPGCIKMFNTTGSRPDWLPYEPSRACPGLIRESSGTQPGSPGLVRGSSVEWWLPDYSRMSPWIPGRVTDEHGWPTDEHGLATGDPCLAPE